MAHHPGEVRRPAGIVLSRRNLPVCEDVHADAGRAKSSLPQGTARGGYIMADTEGTPDVILIATGSEVAGHSGPRNSRRAGHRRSRGFHAFAEWFAEQDAEYRESVLPSSVAARVSR